LLQVGAVTGRRANEREELSAELETALVREIRREWHRLNDSHFKAVLKAPAFLPSDAASRLGRFDRGTRVLELSRQMLLTHGWTALVEVLKHEMAHQYVLEVLAVEDESAHGPAFRGVCERLGIDAKAAGLPENVSGVPDEDKVLGRIARLLALAESSSVHEAEAAMNAAQRLMLKYNLERAEVIREAGPQAAKGSYSSRMLGRPSGRVSEAERMLATILSAFFFVEVIWVPVYRPLEGKRGSMLEICGTPQNLEMASYVHTFLVHAGERLWSEHQRATGTRQNRDRRTFVAGVMSGFSAKLKSERRVQQQQGLVWLGDAELRSFYRRRHPRVVTVRFGGSERNDAHARGRAAGERLVLHKPITSGPSGGTKLLGR